MYQKFSLLSLFISSLCLSGASAATPLPAARPAWTSYPEHVVIPSVDEPKKEKKVAPAKKKSKKQTTPRKIAPPAPPAPVFNEPSDEEMDDFLRFFSNFANLADEDWDSIDDDFSPIGIHDSSGR